MFEEEKKKPHTFHGIPKWLFNLPKGVYTAYEIAKITNQDPQNVRVRMKHLGIQMKQRRNPQTKHLLNVYNWLGAEHHMYEYLERKLNYKEEKEEENSANG